ncbi:MAG: phosphonate metabolism protein/1,5-bisphosphokinase (PRPP-forming) PhnN [Pseudomonadota bacterium]
MSTTGSGRFLAVVGPSGVGKDSVMAALVTVKPEIGIVRRVITRGSGEIGEESISVDGATFETMANEGRFLLHWEAHGLRYGIPIQARHELQAGQTLLVNLSRSVLLEAQARVAHLTVIKLTAPSGVLAERLVQRGRENAAAIEKRLARAERALPDGLQHVWEVSNAGALSNTVQTILDLLQPESALR